jgi:hypothetical protein
MDTKFSIKKFKRNGVSFGDFVILISIARCIYGYFIPLNVLHHAPHDDLLFYRLGVSIANFEWLGLYDQLILLKGAGFPLFLAIVNMLFLPLRVGEALIICAASAYFLSSPIFSKMGMKTKVGLFAVIVFIPFQFGALDYRILRDMIYPWVLLAVLASGSRLFWSLRGGKGFKLNSLIFGFFIGVFDITREESIWILPTLAILALIFLVLSNLKVRKNTLASIALLLLSFLSVVGSNSLANYFAYGSPIRTEFRQGDFAYGYGQLFRFKMGHEVRRGSLSRENWETLFDKIPAALPLREYVFGPAYQGWTRISCEAIRSQHPWENNPDCDDIMLNGYLMMALKDGIFAAGYDTPSKQSAFMKKVGDDIVKYCKLEPTECSAPAKSMMPPETFSIEAVKNTLKNLPRASEVMLDSNNPALVGWHGSGSIFEQIKMAKFLDAKIIHDQQRVIAQSPSQKQKAMLSGATEDSTGAGIIEAVHVDDNILKVYGWVHEPYAGWNVLLQYGEYVCMTDLKILRPDISKIDLPLGFECAIPIDLEKVDFALRLEGVVYNEKHNLRLDISESVKSKISRPLTYFDEACYLRENPDVAAAVLNGQFEGGFNHYELHGFEEGRPCSPLFSHAKLYSGDKDRVISNPVDSAALNFNKLLGSIFQLINLVGLFLIPAALLSLFVRKRYSELSMLVVIVSLILTRVTLISLLDYTGMAPITALYLYSGTVLWLIATLMSAVALYKEPLNLYSSLKKNKYYDAI